MHQSAPMTKLSLTACSHQLAVLMRGNTAESGCVVGEEYFYFNTEKKWPHFAGSKVMKSGSEVTRGERMRHAHSFMYISLDFSSIKKNDSVNGAEKIPITRSSRVISTPSLYLEPRSTDPGPRRLNSGKYFWRKAMASTLSIPLNPATVLLESARTYHQEMMSFHIGCR